MSDVACLASKGRESILLAWQMICIPHRPTAELIYYMNIAVGALFVSIIAAKIVDLFVRSGLGRLALHTKTEIDDMIVESLRKSLFRMLLLAGVRIALNLEILCWIEDPSTQGIAKDSMNTSIYKALVKFGIEIPFPKRDVYVRQLPPSRENWHEDDPAAVRWLSVQEATPAAGFMPLMEQFRFSL
jgi:hypothetical protein